MNRMRTSLCAVVLLLACAARADDRDSSRHFPLSVATEQGAVIGTAVPGFPVIAWRGVPYAAAPVGARRWKPPVDPGRRNAPLAASAFGSHCFQPYDASSSEDCLYLNVWRPDSGGRKLPVFVWIHGGSNVYGSGNGSWYTVAHHYNALVVTLNYRLGAMGWFLHPALKSGDPKADSGNYGTLDQIQALRWVRRNIEQFGGDPDNVTLAGESAGSQNVSYLLHTRLAKNLFRKAIIESNFPGIRPVAAAYKSSKQALYNLLVADGLATDGASAKAYAAGMGDADIRAYLRGKSAADITNAYSNGWWGAINWGDFYRDDIVAGNDYTPPPLVQASQDRPEFIYAIGDGYVLPSDIHFADFSKGHAYPKPLIVGTNKNENNLWNATWPFNFQTGKSLDELVAEAANGTNPDYGYLQNFFDAFGEHDATTFMRNYRVSTRLIDEVDTYLGAHLAARNLAAYTDADDTPVYVYRFDWGSDEAKNYRIPNEDAWKFYSGAIHGAELNFFYQKFFGLSGSDTANAPTYTAGNLPGRQALSLTIRAYLKSFLHSRDGRIERRRDQPVEWRPWTRSAERYLVLDADYATPDVHMSTADISRTPDVLYAAHNALPNAAVRDFIEYYVLWSWHWNWYPNASVGPLDTSPGPNPLFDPHDP